MAARSTYKSICIAVVSFSLTAASCSPPPTPLPHLASDLNMALSFQEAMSRLEDRRVKATRPLIPPQILQEDLPLYALRVLITIVI